MGRQRRLHFSGAIYHITSRGNRRANMFVDERDHNFWLHVLAEAVPRFNLVVYGLCLMPNHFHLLIGTPDANLSSAMHYLNGRYAKRFNWRHSLTGHVLQGRYGAFLVDSQEYLLELLRYIALNPVRSELVARPDDWRWSSHRYCCNDQVSPGWLNVEWVLAQFSGATRTDRIRAYQAFVDAGVGNGKRRDRQPHQHSCRVSDHPTVPTLADLERAYPSRDAAIRAAWLSRAYTRDEIARHFGVSTRTVSRIIADAS